MLKTKYNGLCKHDLRKSRCVECGGSEICYHFRQKFTCVSCNIDCCHEKRLYKCEECYRPFDKTKYSLSDFLSNKIEKKLSNRMSQKLGNKSSNKSSNKIVTKSFDNISNKICYTSCDHIVNDYLDLLKDIYFLGEYDDYLGNLN